MRLRLRVNDYRSAFLLPFALLFLSLHSLTSQNLTVQAGAQTKIYGQPDPMFPYAIQGFANGDTGSVVSGQPYLSAPQRVQNLWQFTESLPPSLYRFWQFSPDGTSTEANGIQLPHVTTGGNFYSSVSSSLASLPSGIVYPGMHYLLSFYALSSDAEDEVYWHRYLTNGGVAGWGRTAIGPSLRRVVFHCAGTVKRALDCGVDPTVPLGEGPDQTELYWLFLGDNNALDGNLTVPGVQKSIPDDIYIGGFQMEPSVTEKRGVVAMGDSLTQYDCSTDDSLSCTSWTAFAASQLDVPFYNRGVYGQTCEQIQARWATDASPILAANAKYAIIFCGTNDISSGFSAIQTEQSIAAMTAMAAADGATPVVATVGPFNATVANAESTRQAINAWIRTTYPLVLDFDRVNGDPANPAQQNPSYVGDGVHLNVAGRVAEGNYVANSIAGNSNGYPAIWNFHAPIPYQPVPGFNPSNGMDFHLGAQREAGSYIILPEAGTLASGKYSFTFASALFTVAPAPLSVSVNNKSMTYGTPLPMVDGTITGALAADNISASYSTIATSTSPPGTYVITPALIDPDNRLSNYTVTQTPGTLSIVPAICAAPTFTAAPGTYAAPFMVSVLDSTPGAVMHYTTDGTMPTAASPVYTGPIGVPNSEIVQAIAIALPDYSASPVAASGYTIVPVVSGVSPWFTAAGNAGFTLTVTGTGFGAASVVHFGAVALATQFVSPSTLSAQVPASALAASGATSVTVQDTANSSNALQFEIDSSGASTYAPVFSPASATIAAGATATYAVTLPATAANVSVSCLNLPANAVCSYAAGALTIGTGPSTPAGAYEVTAVFTETVPVPAFAWIFLPFVLVPAAGISRQRRRRALFLLALLLGGIAGLGGCGGSSPAPSLTQQVTSSGIVVLNVH